MRSFKEYSNKELMVVDMTPGDPVEISNKKLKNKKVDEVSQKTLGNYMRKSAADAGKPNTSARQQDKRIGGQKMADDKMRKAQGKGSAAKVAATEEYVEGDDMLVEGPFKGVGKMMMKRKLNKQYKKSDRANFDDGSGDHKTPKSPVYGKTPDEVRQKRSDYYHGHMDKAARAKKAMNRLSRKEAFEPHMMYDPETGKGYKADTEADHLRMKKMGYTHDKPTAESSVDEGDGLWHNIHKKRKEGRPMRKPGSKGAPTKQDFKNASEATIPDGQTAMTKKPELTKKDTKTMGKIADLMKRANEKKLPEGEGETTPCPSCDGSLENHSPDCPRAGNSKTGKDVATANPKAGDQKDAAMAEDNTDEALDMTARRKKSRQMKRLKSRIKLGRERAKRKMADPERLKKRARKAARTEILKKLTKGVDKSQLTYARRQELEKRLDKPAIKARIDRLSKKMLPATRRKELDRRRGGASDKK